MSLWECKTQCIHIGLGNDCDKTFNESNGCGSTEQMKDNKNDYYEDISTEKLTESQNRELTDW